MGFKVSAYPRCQPSAADRHEYIINVCERFDDFYGYRTLSLNNPGVVEWGYEDHIMLSGNGNRVVLAFVERVSDEDNFNSPVSEHLRLVDLLLWCDHRHINSSADTQVATGKGKALRVITGTGAHHSLKAFLFGKALDKVIGTSQFVRPHHLQVFPLQVDLGAILFRKFFMRLQRRVQHNVSEHFEGSVDVDGIRFFASHLTLRFLELRGRLHRTH